MEKTYTLEQIKAYAKSWLKPASCTDMKDSVIENERLSSFIHYIDIDDSCNIDNFLNNRLKIDDIVFDKNGNVGKIQSILNDGSILVINLSGIDTTYTGMDQLKRVNPFYKGEVTGW